MMQVNNLRKTHPLLLIVAVAITVFSLLLSAAIAGWIPGDYFDDQKESSGKKNTVLSTSDSTIETELGYAKTPVAKTPVFLRGYKHNIQPKVLLNLWFAQGPCMSCGKITSINTVSTKDIGPDGYAIKIQMESGSYQTITQFIEPRFIVGDRVKLINSSQTMA